MELKEALRVQTHAEV